MKEVYLLALILLMSCKAKPKLSNSFNSKITWKKYSDPEKILYVNVNTLPLPEKPKEPKKEAVKIFQLRDSLPHKLIEVFADKTTNVKDLVEAFKLPLSKIESDKPKIPELPNNRIKLRFQFSNIKKYFNDEIMVHPNTRLDRLNTTLTITNGNYHFLTIDRLENEIEEMDMGTLKRTNKVSYNGKLTGNLGSTSNTQSTDNKGYNNTFSNTNGGNRKLYDENGNEVNVFQNSDGNSFNYIDNNSKTDSSSTGAGINGELSYNNEDSIEEAVNLQLRRPKTSFSFSKDKLIVSQKGFFNYDISDNVFVTATLEANSLSRIVSPANALDFSSIYDKDGKYKKVNSIGFKRKPFEYVPCMNSQKIPISIYYEGSLRTVDTKNGNNLLEYDDNITYYNFSKQLDENTLIIDKWDNCNDVFIVIAESKTTNKKYRLCIDDSLSRQQNEVVELYDNKYSFLRWLSHLQSLSQPNLKANFELFLLNTDDINDKIVLLSNTQSLIDISVIRDLKFVYVDKEKSLIR